MTTFDDQVRTMEMVPELWNLLTNGKFWYDFPGLEQVRIIIPAHELQDPVVAARWQSVAEIFNTLAPRKKGLHGDKLYKGGNIQVVLVSSKGTLPSAS